MSTAPALLDRAPVVHTRLPHPLGGPGSQHRGLSRDDLRLLSVIATGIPLTSVAGRLGISDRTVRRRVRSICDDLGVTTMIESVAWAARRRLI